MLSDHERKTLRELERQFSTEDPTFAQSFDARTQRLRHSRKRVGTKIFLAAGLLLSALMLVSGSLSGAVAFATSTGLIWLAWRFLAGWRERLR